MYVCMYLCMFVFASACACALVHAFVRARRQISHTLKQWGAAAEGLECLTVVPGNPGSDPGAAGRLF